MEPEDNDLAKGVYTGEDTVQNEEESAEGGIKEDTETPAIAYSSLSSLPSSLKSSSSSKASSSS